MADSHYAVLGVSETASPEEIKKVYRALAKIYHPDSGTTKDEAKFKEVQEAYDVLSDSTKRQAYDAERKKGPKAQAASAGTGGNGSEPDDTPPEYTPEHWEMLWRWGSTDLPDEWTDELVAAYKQVFGKAPPGQERPKPPPRQKSTKPPPRPSSTGTRPQPKRKGSGGGAETRPSPVHTQRVSSDATIALIVLSIGLLIIITIAIQNPMPAILIVAVALGLIFRS